MVIVVIHHLKQMIYFKLVKLYMVIINLIDWVVQLKLVMMVQLLQSYRMTHLMKMDM